MPFLPKVQQAEICVCLYKVILNQICYFHCLFNITTLLESYINDVVNWKASKVFAVKSNLSRELYDLCSQLLVI